MVPLWGSIFGTREFRAATPLSGGVDLPPGPDWRVARAERTKR